MPKADGLDAKRHQQQAEADPLPVFLGQQEVGHLTSSSSVSRGNSLAKRRVTKRPVTLERQRWTSFRISHLPIEKDVALPLQFGAGHQLVKAGIKFDNRAVGKPQFQDHMSA